MKATNDTILRCHDITQGDYEDYLYMMGLPLSNSPISFNDFVNLTKNNKDLIAHRFNEILNKWKSAVEYWVCMTNRREKQFGAKESEATKKDMPIDWSTMIGHWILVEGDQREITSYRVDRYCNEANAIEIWRNIHSSRHWVYISDLKIIGSYKED